jgi:predicted nucleic acid-binding protein
MNEKEPNISGRVRENTPEEQNMNLDQMTLSNIELYGKLSEAEITQRLEELRREWDIERTLEVNASSVMLTTLILAALGNKRWYFISGMVAGFLLQQGLKVWCPPLTLLRTLGVRTRQEIDEEIYALKVLRGDFNGVSATSGSAAILDTIRR